MSPSGTISEAMVEATAKEMAFADRSAHDMAADAEDLWSHTAEENRTRYRVMAAAALSVPAPGTGGAERLREALTRISAMTPAAANAATARDLHLTVSAIADAALASTPQAGDLGAVKVKPLEWTHVSDARCIGGFRPNEIEADRYTIKRRLDVYHLDDGKFTFMNFEFDTVEAAQAAAQSHFESRILSALSSSPVGEMVLVPREPTEAMLATQGKSRPDLAKTEGARRSAEALNIEMRRMAREIWAEMLAASPQGGR